MGVYDTVRIGTREGQVKCWDSNLDAITQGDKVSSIRLAAYSIAMREGGYVNVLEDTVEGWTDTPRYEHVIDKWGDDFSERSAGLLGEGYFFESVE